MASTAITDKKKALLAYKQKLLDELNYYDKRIEDLHANGIKRNSFEDDDSSDSDTGLPILDLGPSVTELKIHQSKLMTCLQATQELTSLQIPQSEVNIMVDDPVLDGEPPVTEAGVWREVTAECRIDCLPFSIMFYAHKPTRLFGQTSYRGLRVSALKSAHEAELCTSVLPTLDTPADAIQVLRSYTTAYRSRRTTLAKLTERYGHALFMEPYPQGGYVLKCADLLVVLWRLENSRSSLAHFYHNMRFNFEYMDECYVKIITQAHKELSNPSVDTAERTFLLSKIISTCLEAQGSPHELYESMESDQESVKRVEKRQASPDREIESPEEKKRREDNIMAPPKYLPKKGKPKGKENTGENSSKGVKRMSSNDRVSSKRAKISQEGNVKRIDNKDIEQDSRRDKNTKKVIGERENNVATNTNDVVKENIEKIRNVATKKKVDKAKAIKVSENNDAEEKAVNNVDKAKSVLKAANSHASNDQISAKSKDNLNNKGDHASNQNDNLGKKSVTASSNAKTKETTNTNTTNKKQKSQENLKENNNIKKSTSNKNSGNQNSVSNAKSKETADTNASTKKQKSQENLKENNNVKKSTSNINIVNQNQNSVPNAKTKEAAIKNAKTADTNATTKKQKSQENLIENNNVKKSTSNKNIVNQNQNSVPNAKTKEAAIKNAKTKETVDSNATTKKQKSQENLIENNNVKKSTSDINTVHQNQNSVPNSKTKETANNNAKTNKQKSQENINVKKSISNKNSVPKNGESTIDIVKKPKTSNEKPETTESDAKTDNAKANLGKIQRASQRTEASKTTEKTPENMNKNQNAEIAKKSKANEAENTNKAKTVVAKVKGSKENNKNYKESNNNNEKEANNAKNGVDGTRSSVNKNKDQNNAMVVEKKSTANIKNKANTNVATSKNNKSNTVQKVTERNVAANKNKDNIADVATLNRQGSKDSLSNKKTNQNNLISAYNNKPPLKILNKHNMPAKKIPRPGSSGAFLKPGSTEKKDGEKISSKIPQKAMKKITESDMKKNPLRISPRKMASMFKNPSQPNLNQKMQKPSTNIPRLMKSSTVKPKS